MRSTSPAGSSTLRDLARRLHKHGPAAPPRGGGETNAAVRPVLPGEKAGVPCPPGACARRAGAGPIGAAQADRGSVGAPPAPVDAAGGGGATTTAPPARRGGAPPPPAD